MKHHMRSRARVESVVHQLNYQLLVGIDLGQWLHQACVLDANGEFLGERGFEHSLSALSATTDWLLNLAGKDAERIAVAIEKPHGAVVETLLDRRHRRFLHQLRTQLCPRPCSSPKSRGLQEPQWHRSRHTKER